MEGERRVLQNRVQAVALDRWRIKPPERIRRQHDEGQEGKADRALNRQHPRPQLQRQITAEDCHGAAIYSQNQYPQNHRAFMVSPYATDLVKQRLGRMRICSDILYREIRDDVGVCQNRKGKGDERQLQHRRGNAGPHQRCITAMRANQRHKELIERHTGGKDQRKMSDLGDHCSAPFPSFTPFSFKLSANSRGM